MDNRRCTKEEMKEIALRIRRRVLKSAWLSGGGHIAPSYSMTELITALYFGGLMTYRPDEPLWTDRDYFILSKGHGVLALYAALAIAGYFDEKLLDSFCRPGSDFGSLARTGAIPGIEATTGSLGHGLSYGVGIALACRMDHRPNKIYVLLGDGECEEGSVWEGLMSAVHYKLDNLTVIVDHNRLQAMGEIQTILSFDRLKERFSAFGGVCTQIDGHDFDAIKNAMCVPHDGCPLFVIADTTKGKGISFMENRPIWHYRVPDDKEIKIAAAELGMTGEEFGIRENGLHQNII